MGSFCSRRRHDDDDEDTPQPAVDCDGQYQQGTGPSNPSRPLRDYELTPQTKEWRKNNQTYSHDFGDDLQDHDDEPDFGDDLRDDFGDDDA